MNLRKANETWEAFFRAHTTLMRTFLAENIWEELSISEYDVLYTLSKSERPMRLGELREGVMLSQPALSRLVERLVCRGLVERDFDIADRRALHLTITDEGRLLQQRVGRAHAKSVAREMSRLEENELKTLQALCRKLAGGIK